jgi:hypothetical protein
VGLDADGGIRRVVDLPDNILAMTRLNPISRDQCRDAQVTFDIVGNAAVDILFAIDDPGRRYSTASAGGNLCPSFSERVRKIGIGLAFVSSLAG